MAILQLQCNYNWIDRDHNAFEVSVDDVRDAMSAADDLGGERN